MLIKEVMRKPVFVSPEETLKNAAKIMAQSNMGGLLIGSEKKLLGVVTKEDLVKHFGHKEKVSEIMTKAVVGVKFGADIEEAVSIFRKNRISILPVFDNNKISGVVSSKDVMKIPVSDADDDDFLFG